MHLSMKVHHAYDSVSAFAVLQIFRIFTNVLYISFCYTVDTNDSFDKVAEPYILWPCCPFFWIVFHPMNINVEQVKEKP